MRGWRYESARHALAARGIRTRFDARKYLKMFDPWEQMNVMSRMNVAVTAREGMNEDPGFDAWRFAQFMGKRFTPGAEHPLIGGQIVKGYTASSYADEWKDRFIRGRAWDSGDYQARAVLKELYPEIYGNWDVERSEYVEPSAYAPEHDVSPDPQPLPKPGQERTPVFTNYYEMVEYAKKLGTLSSRENGCVVER